MPPTGSTFTDWQQVEKESRLLMNEDFSWSEPPQRRRRPITDEPIRARRRAAVVEYEPEPISKRDLSTYDFDEPAFEMEVEEIEGWDQPTAEHSHFDELMAQWNDAYGDSGEGDAFDLSDQGSQVLASGARRTVVITGRGDERFVPAPRRRPSSDLRFHERSTFSPDRAGLWAVLLSIALVIGAIAH